MSNNLHFQWAVKIYPGKVGRDYLGLDSGFSENVQHTLSRSIKILVIRQHFLRSYVFLLLMQNLTYLVKKSSL